MLRLIDPTRPIAWVHPIERGKPNPTVFYIVPLTEGKDRALRATVDTPDGSGITLTIIQKQILETFISQVDRIENVVWPGTTAPVIVTSRVEKLRFLDHMPVELWGDVYRAIRSLSALDEGELKNSGALPDSSISPESPAGPTS